jgi:hypothetical protein
MKNTFQNGMRCLNVLQISSSGKNKTNEPPNMITYLSFESQRAVVRVLVAGPKLVIPAKKPNPAWVQALERKEHRDDLKTFKKEGAIA